MMAMAMMTIEIMAMMTMEIMDMMTMEDMDMMTMVDMDMMNMVDMDMMNMEVMRTTNILLVDTRIMVVAILTTGEWMLQTKIKLPFTMEIMKKMVTFFLYILLMKTSI